MAQPCQPPDPDPKAPDIAPPPGACDTHAHIYGPFDRFPVAPTRGYDPPDCRYEKYCALLKALGIERAVIVQGSASGANHGAMLDAMHRAAGRFRGVAVVRPETAEAEIAAMEAAGVCGMRLSTVTRTGLGTDHLERMADRAAELGWLVQLHLHDIDELVALGPRLRAMKTRLLIDHMGRGRGGPGIAQPGFRAQLDLLRKTDHCWSKICSWYRMSDAGPPYDDMAPFARALIEARPDRLVWGSNWPHPNITIPMPNDGVLFDQFMAWAGDEATRQQILAENPARLFGFD